MDYANSHHRHVHEGATFEIADQSEIEDLIANEVEDGEEKSATAFREAGEALRRVWDFIFSDTAGRPLEFSKQAYEEHFKNCEHVAADNRERQQVAMITRNMFVITLMLRPDRLEGFNSIRTLATLLDVSRETLSRIQIRASEALKFHARSQRVQPRATGLQDRLKRNKGKKTKSKQ